MNLLIDGRCGCRRCRGRTENIYRMVGERCSNCGAGPFLIVYREGDRAAAQDCPRCGNWRTVGADRLATEEEIPVAFEGGAR